jgi:hypothetical protein
MIRLLEKSSPLKSNYSKFCKQNPMNKVSGFSVPRCRFASDGISASLQQVSARLEVSVFGFQYSGMSIKV